MNSEYDFEPVKGLPAELPRGEQLLWQGSPQWKSLALHGYHVRKFALYFVLLVLWRAGEGMAGGESAAQLLLGCAWLLLLGTVVCTLLLGLARLAARATLYTITNRRIVMRHGIALPMSVNIPFTAVQAASMRVYADGSGEICVALLPNQRLGYLLNWPHVRPWKFAEPQAMLRTVPQATLVAELLIGALRSAVPGAVASQSTDAGLPTHSLAA